MNKRNARFLLERTILALVECDNQGDRRELSRTALALVQKRQRVSSDGGVAVNSATMRYRETARQLTNTLNACTDGADPVSNERRAAIHRVLAGVGKVEVQRPVNRLVPLPKEPRRPRK